MRTSVNSIFGGTVVAAGLLAMTCGHAAAAAPAYTFSSVDFTNPNSASTSVSAVVGINGSGTVVGQYAGLSGFAQPAMSANGVVTPLPTLGGRGGSAYAVNNSGLVVGFSRVKDPNDPLAASPQHATAWVNAQAIDLGLPANAVESFAYDVSAGGRISGMSDFMYDTDGNGSLDTRFGRATVFSTASAPTVYGTLGGNSRYSSALGINDKYAVGYAENPDAPDAVIATYWDSAGVVRRINPIAGDYSLAEAINENGIITGYVGNDVNNINQNAMLFDTATGVTTLLPNLTNPTFHQGAANALSQSGRYVVGLSYNDNFDAFVATAWIDGAAYELSTLVNLPTGWSFFNANSVNDAGQIVGVAFDANGVSRGYQLNLVPEPAMLTLIGLPAALLLRRRGRAIGRES